jgi:hypothetical protein
LLGGDDQVPADQHRASPSHYALIPYRPGSAIGGTRTLAARGGCSDNGDGTLTPVGAPATRHTSPAIFSLLVRRRSIAGSGIRGIPETQEMLDFCAARNIGSDVEMIAMEAIERAYARLLRGDIRYRFVIDMQTLVA